MNKAALFLLMAFASIAVFGFAAMHTDMGRGMAGCIASAVEGISCPMQATPIEESAFHMDAFRSFSTAVVATYFVLLCVSIIFAFSFVLAAEKLKTGFSSLSFIRFSLATRRGVCERPFSRWIALHLNSPSLA